MRKIAYLPPFAALLLAAACSSQGTPTTTPGPAGTAPGSDQPTPATTVQGTQAGVAKNDDDSTRVDVVDHTFTITAGESVRVFLSGGAIYRAELNGTGMRLELRSVDQSLQAPMVEEFVPGTGAGGTSIFTIRPRQDGEYEIRTAGGSSGAPLTLHITRQPAN